MASTAQHEPQITPPKSPSAHEADPEQGATALARAKPESQPFF